MKQLILMQIWLIIIIFKSFEYKTKLSRNTESDGNNGILKNATIAVTLKYLSNFLESLKMLFID